MISFQPRSMTKGFATALVVMAVALSASSSDASGITVYKDGDKYLKMGGRIQLQFHSENPNNDEVSDTVFFRRLRPYIEGSVHKDWVGKFQWDMGQGEFSVKDAYFKYKGVKDLKVTIGNAQFPFSRESMSSSKTQQLVERTFVGDHNFGTPERNAGLFLHYGLADGMVELHAAGGSASIDPDAGKLDFDTPISADADFNQGLIYGGRIDFHPLGKLKMAQGDFKGEPKATISVAAFQWSNDDDNNTRTNALGQADDDITTAVIDATKKPDMDNVNGFEVSAGLRGYGLSVDAEYNLFQAELIDDTYTGGLFKNGETDLKNWAVEGGYMVIPKTLELVAGYEALDADNYAKLWTRTSVGANWFIAEQDIKLQATYRMGSNLKGVKDADANELFVQAQYVF